MKKEIKTKWIKALRSRKYKQGRAILINDSRETAPTHCCLGVLCEVMKWPGNQWKGLSLLSEGLLEKVGLTKKNQDELIRRNDGFEGNMIYPKQKQQKFYQIARWIEKNL